MSLYLLTATAVVFAMSLAPRQDQKARNLKVEPVKPPCVRPTLRVVETRTNDIDTFQAGFRNTGKYPALLEPTKVGYLSHYAMRPTSKMRRGIVIPKSWHRPFRNSRGVEHD